MLASSNRLTDGADFRQVVRRGRRAGNSLLVVHLAHSKVDKDINTPSRIGFVVAKTVGSSVTRNKVKRRLRHLMRERLDLLPGQSMVVIRALPGSATAGFNVLGDELDRCLARCLEPVGTAR